MTTRANIKITILQVLDRLPAAYTQRVSALRAEVSLDMSPSRNCRYRPGHPGAGGPAPDHVHHLPYHRRAQVRHHRRRPRPAYPDMTITDAIVSIAALILIGFINYIIYRR